MQMRNIELLMTNVDFRCAVLGVSEIWTPENSDMAKK